MRTLYDDGFFWIVQDETRKLVRVTRSDRSFPDVDEARRVFGAMAALVRSMDLAGYVLLIDSRDAPGRNDEAFESVVGAVRAQLVERFEKRALLLRTVVGVMQTQRMERTFGGPHIEPFADEAAALAYLGIT